MYFVSLLEGKYDGDLVNPTYERKYYPTRNWRIFAAKKPDYKKPGKKCYVSEKRLVNLLRKILELEPSFWSKKSVGNLYWKFMKNYGVKKPCTCQHVHLWKLHRTGTKYSDGLKLTE